jgi:DHA1 family tetracycline resistance protein-like MFS transporter
MLALGIIVPVFPQLIVQMNGGSEAQAAHWVGLSGTLWALMQFAAMPLVGALSDRIGRRPVVLLSNFGQGADYVVMALAPDLWWLLLGRIISGVTTASASTAFAYVADVTPPEKRAGAFGLLGAAFGLGFVIGPAVGGLLGGIEPRLPFWVAGVLSLLNGMYGLFVLPESLPAERRAAFSWGKANPLGSFAMLRANVVYPATFALYGMHRYHWGPREVGVTLALVGVSSIVVQAGLMGRIVAAIGERRALMTGLACGAIGFCVYGFSTAPWMLYCAIPITAFWGLAGPSGQALMSQRVHPSEQGRLQGALSSLTGIAGLLGPSLFTGVFAYFITSDAPMQAPGAAFFTASVLVALSLFAAQRALRAAD